MSNPPAVPHFYLLTHPRTCSSLLLRILSLDEQENIFPPPRGGYFFKSAFFLSAKLKARGRHVDTLSENEIVRLKQEYQTCFDKMNRHISKAQSLRRAVFTKEHITFVVNPVAETHLLFPQQGTSQLPWTVNVPGQSRSTHSPLNKTILPDEFLRIWKPTFLIRHPALVFPSIYRTTLDLEGQEYAETQENWLQLELTMHWTRTMYDWYVEQNNGGDDCEWPIVLEADDIITKPDTLIRFCEIVGLDSSKLQFSWPPASLNERQSLPSITQRMKSTLLASSGIMTDKSAANLEIGAEARKWRQEFGDSQGAKIEKYVRAAIPDYEYLKTRRLRPKSGGV